MRVSIYGCGYVGLVTGACLADSGIEVGLYDIDLIMLEDLVEGISPIKEPDLGDLLESGFDKGTIRIFMDIKDAVDFGAVHIITVGTPIAKNGDLDLSNVMSVASEISRHLKKDATIVNKSTSPVGTLERIEKRFQDPKFQEIKVGFVSNPEFLTVGQAVENFKDPDRIIVGGDNEESLFPVLEMYKEANLIQKIVTMESKSAELTKYASNAMLATRISFMNEMAELAYVLDVDIDEVIIGIGSDQRIGSRYLNPGAGFGGSCLPKDVKALISLGDRVGTNMTLMSAVDRINERQKVQMFKKIKMSYSFLSDRPGLAGRTFAFWGLSYKKATDDTRDSPALALIDDLLREGTIIKAYDPAAGNKVKEIYGDLIEISDNKENILTNADGLVIMTDWDEFKEADLQVIKDRLRHQIIFDGRNLFDPKEMKNLGIAYYSSRRAR